MFAVVFLLVASILFHDPRLSSVSGGGETVTLQLISLLAESGHEVTILTRQASRTRLFEDALLKSSKVRVLEMSMTSLGHAHARDDGDNFARALWDSDQLAPESLAFNVAARQFYRDHSFDLVVVSFILDLAGLATRDPILLNVFGLPPDLKTARLERRLLERCSHFTFASHYARTEFSRLFELDAGAVLGPVVHASIHPAFFGPTTTSGRAFDVCYAGRLVRRKGLDGALDAVSWLKFHCDLVVSMAVAGDGPERDALHAHAARMGVAEQVRWLGSLSTDGVVGLFDRSSVFVYPTVLPEAFGCSNLEAMARGLVVITSNIGGTADYVEPGDNALVCEPADPASLAGCIELALRNAEVHTRLSRNSQATAKRFTQEIQAGRWLSFFQEALDGRRRS
ncbi:MAG: glycosyltransferase family 4 protein [Bryobacteraceae bacterium]